MKIYLRSYIDEGKIDELGNKEMKINEIACADLKQAELAKQAGDKIHLCFHDEENPKSCRLI